MKRHTIITQGAMDNKHLCETCYFVSHSASEMLSHAEYVEWPNIREMLVADKTKDFTNES